MSMPCLSIARHRNLRRFLRFAFVLAGAMGFALTTGCTSSTEPRERVLTLEVAPTLAAENPTASTGEESS